MKRLWKDSLSLRDNLRRRLPKLARRYFADGDLALAQGTAWEDMHKFRLRTKRFRYTIETFRDLYGPGIDKRIDSLKKVQTYLGDINDRITSIELLKNSAHTEGIQETLAGEAEELTQELREYWANTFSEGQPRSAWIQYLVTYACRPSIVPRVRRLLPAK